MKEILRTNDVVLLSWVQSLLRDARIGCWVLDGHTSVLEGSLGILPRRLVVAEEDADTARSVLIAAEVAVLL
jgi:hypothetical protein